MSLLQRKFDTINLPQSFGSEVFCSLTLGENDVPKGERKSLFYIFPRFVSKIISVILTDKLQKLYIILDRQRRSSVRFLLSVIVFLSLWVFVYSVWITLGCPISPVFLTNLLLVLSGFLLIFIPVPKSKCLSAESLGKKLLEGVFLALCGVLFLCAVKAVIIAVNPSAFSDRPFFDFSRLTLWDAFYAVSVVWQEFIARAVLYEGLSKIMKRSRALPLIISSLYFGAVHVHLGLVYMLGAVALLSLFGLIYIKQRSIWGVCVPHYVLGLALLILGFV